MLTITQQEFDEIIKSNSNVEIFTKNLFDTYIEDNKELLIKADSGQELEEFEKSEVVELLENIRSFAVFEVFGREPHQSDIQKSIYYIREKQIEWEKNNEGDLLKARAGTYTNTATNRRLHRVGSKYGLAKKPEEKKEDKGEIKLTEGLTFSIGEQSGGGEVHAKITSINGDKITIDTFTKDEKKPSHTFSEKQTRELIEEGGNKIKNSKKKEPEDNGSEQLKLVKELVSKHSNDIDKDIIDLADNWDPKRDDEEDIVFEPFNKYPEYEELVGDEGNEDDEVDFMNTHFKEVLKREDPKKYSKVISWIDEF